MRVPPAQPAGPAGGGLRPSLARPRDGRLRVLLRAPRGRRLRARMRVLGSHGGGARSGRRHDGVIGHASLSAHARGGGNELRLGHRLRFQDPDEAADDLGRRERLGVDRAVEALAPHLQRDHAACADHGRNAVVAQHAVGRDRVAVGDVHVDQRQIDRRASDQVQGVAVATDRTDDFAACLQDQIFY